MCVFARRFAARKRWGLGVGAFNFFEIICLKMISKKLKAPTPNPPYCAEGAIRKLLK